MVARLAPGQCCQRQSHRGLCSQTSGPQAVQRPSQWPPCWPPSRAPGLCHAAPTTPCRSPAHAHRHTDCTDSTLQKCCTCEDTCSLHRQHPGEVLHIRTDTLTVRTTPCRSVAHAHRHVRCTDNILQESHHICAGPLVILITPCQSPAHAHRQPHPTGVTHAQLPASSMP